MQISQELYPNCILMEKETPLLTQTSTWKLHINELSNCNYVTDFKVAWRKIKCRIWRLQYRAHNVIVHSLSYDIDHQLDTRMTKCLYSCLNHSNSVCRSLSSSKLHCVRSTFAANFK